MYELLYLKTSRENKSLAMQKRIYFKRKGCFLMTDTKEDEKLVRN